MSVATLGHVRPDLELWHIGCAVADIGAWLRDEALLGATLVSDVARITIHTFDAARGLIEEETLDVAWVAYPDGKGTLELISPVSDGPQARLLRNRPGTSHLAYWCRDFGQAAAYLMDNGAQLVLAVLAAPPSREQSMAQMPHAEVIAQSQTCYLRMPGGSVIELNTAASRDGMSMVWGEAVLDVVPVASWHKTA